MPIHLEFTADTPGQLSRVLDALNSDAVTMELTPQGDLYLTIDLRETDDEATPVDLLPAPDTLTVIRAELADLETLYRAAVRGGQIDSATRISQRRAGLLGLLATMSNQEAEGDAPADGPRRVVGVDGSTVVVVESDGDHFTIINEAPEPAAPRVHDGTIRVGDRVVGTADMRTNDRDDWVIGVVSSTDEHSAHVRWPDSAMWTLREHLVLVTKLDDDGKVVEVWDHEDGCPVTVTDPEVPEPEPDEAAAPEPEVRPVVRPWEEPVLASHLVRLGAADAAPRPAEGDRVVHVGDGWPVTGAPSRWVAAGAPIAHVVGANNDTVILELPDGSEGVLHVDKVALVGSVNSVGFPIILLGDPPAAETPASAPVDVPVTRKPKNPPVLPGPGRPSTVPSKYGPGTRPGCILELLDADPGVEWKGNDIAAKVQAKGFKASSAKAMLSPLTRDGFIVRVEPGVFRSNLDG